MRYYSTQRPVTPGSFPGGCAVDEIVNFDRKTFCEEIGREAWGYIDFAAQLPDGEAERWGWPPPGGPHRCVEAVEKPENRSTSTRRKDIYTDWFDSREEAEKFIEEAKRA